MKRSRHAPDRSQFRPSVLPFFRSSCSGSILILALWALAFLAALAIAVAAHVSGVLETARRHGEWVRARAAAASGAQSGAAMLAWYWDEWKTVLAFTQEQDTVHFKFRPPYSAGDPEYHVAIGDYPRENVSLSGAVSNRVVFFAKRTAIDIATADLADLEKLFNGDAGNASALAIHQWRTNHVGLTGRQRADYHSRVLALGPWGTPQELFQVPGVTTATVADAWSRVTVFDSGQYVEGESTGWAAPADGSSGQMARVRFVVRHDGRIVYWQED